MPKEFSREIPKDISINHLKFLDDMFVSQFKTSREFRLTAAQLLSDEFKNIENVNMTTCIRTTEFWWDNFSRGIW